MRRLILLAAALAGLASPALSQQAPPAQEPPSRFALENGAELSNATATIRVTALTDSILRVRITRDRHRQVLAELERRRNNAAP